MTLRSGQTLLVGVLAAVAIAGQARAQPYPAAVPRADHCAALAGMTVKAGHIEDAQRLVTGAAIVGGDIAGTKVSTNICRVRLTLQPVPGSDIEVEVWLPDRWNKKLYAVGGGGFDGGLNPTGAAFLNRAIGQGYAAIGTDVGHKPAPILEPWVHKQPQKVIDFGYRGNHLAAVAAKRVIDIYYHRAARHAYLLSCSNGGRDAIMEVSRYPEDYDGVVAGDPARRFVEILTQLTWNYQVIHGPNGAPNLESKLHLVYDAVIKKCDRIDGVADGVLENPHLCNFNPAVLECKGADGPTCLTRTEIEALRKIYAGPRLRGGEQIISGLEPGSEGVPGGWTDWVTTPKIAFVGEQFYRWMVYDDPKWKVQSFSLDRDYPVARARLAPILDADNPDLRAFARRGGKLIIYQGWDDAVVPPGDTIEYYEAVRRRLGPETERHVRLFMVPGMGHCGGGPGATRFDMQPVLEKWVEHGEAPQSVVAVKPGSGNPPFTHLLCPWPKVAHYNGSGSTRDAANFSCEAPRRNWIN